MMTRRFIALWISASLFVSISDRAAAADDRDARLAAICASCHRLDGGGGGMASIVGWDVEKLIGAMQAFKSDERSSHIMRAVSLSLSDDEIAALARYLAARSREAK